MLGRDNPRINSFSLGQEAQLGVTASLAQIDLGPKWGKTKESFKIPRKNQHLWAGIEQVLLLQNQIYWEESPDWTVLDHSSHHRRGLSESKSPQDLEQFYFPFLNFVCSEIWEESYALEAPGTFPLTLLPRMSQVTLYTGME